MSPKTNKHATKDPRTDLFHLDPDDVLLIEDPHHILYDERVKLPVDQIDVDDVKLNGVIEPVIARKEDGKVIVIAGRQRTKWLREANRQLRKEGQPPRGLPVIFKRSEARDLFGLTLSENAHRTDLTPMQKARIAAQASDRGMLNDEIAIRMKVDAATVVRWLELTKAPTSVQKAVEAGTVSVKAAIRIAGLTDERQTEELEAAKTAAKAEGKVAPGEVRKAVSKRLEAVGRESRGLKPNNQPSAKAISEHIEWLRVAYKDDPLPSTKGMIEALEWVKTGLVGLNMARIPAGRRSETEK
jgi:ParB family transcriptional regulator, chromosome partitioning protein